MSYLYRRNRKFVGRRRIRAGIWAFFRFFGLSVSVLLRFALFVPLYHKYGRFYIKRPGFSGGSFFGNFVQKTHRALFRVDTGVGINIHRCREVGVTEELLYVLGGRAGGKEVGGVGVAEEVEMEVFEAIDPAGGFFGGFFDKVGRGEGAVGFGADEVDRGETLGDRFNGGKGAELVVAAGALAADEVTGLIDTGRS